MLKKIIKIILLIIWMGVIFSFSSDSGVESKSKSTNVIVKTHKVITNKELTTKQKNELVEKTVYPVRKFAHFFEYLIFGILVISLVSEYTVLNKKAIIICLIIYLLYPITDEIHQIFSDERTPKLLDILVDTSGTIVGAHIYLTYKGIIRRIKDARNKQKKAIS